MPNFAFRVCGLCLAFFSCGCKAGHYSTYVTNGSGRDIDDVRLLDLSRNAETRIGPLVSGQSSGFGPCIARSAPSSIRLSWKESGVSYERDIAVPKAIREKIRGKSEDLYFVIRNDRSVVVYLEIPNPRDLTSPSYYPSDLSPAAVGDE